MSDDQALPGNPLISAATRSGRSRAVMEITRLEASTRALRGCGCPADNARRLLLLRSPSCCPENRVTAALLSPGELLPTCAAPPSPSLGGRGSLGSLPSQALINPPAASPCQSCANSLPKS